jgi:hypothetical protein
LIQTQRRDDLRTSPVKGTLRYLDADSMNATAIADYAISATAIVAAGQNQYAEPGNSALGMGIYASV